MVKSGETDILLTLRGKICPAVCQLRLINGGLLAASGSDR
jgi:hypothetical protein